MATYKRSSRPHTPGEQSGLERGMVVAVKVLTNAGLYIRMRFIFRTKAEIFYYWLGEQSGLEGHGGCCETAQERSPLAGTQFTCFTGTKVRILTQVGPLRMSSIFRTKSLWCPPCAIRTWVNPFHQLFVFFFFHFPNPFFALVSTSSSESRCTARCFYLMSIASTFQPLLHYCSLHVHINIHTYIHMICIYVLCLYVGMYQYICSYCIRICVDLHICVCTFQPRLD